MAIEEDFERRLWEICHEATRRGYPDQRFEGKLRELGGVNTAKHFIGKAGGEIQTGLYKMVRADLPDLTLEAAMLEPRFQSLFSQQLLDAARFRLDYVKQNPGTR